jgi:hypothetical protein
MTTAATRRRLGALAVAVAAALLPAAGIGSALSPSYANPPAPSPSPTANDDAPAQILVTTLAPRAPMDPNEFFQVSGRIVNRGSQTLHGLTVRLRRGDRLYTRSQLTAADTDLPSTTVRVGQTPVRAALQDLPPGASTTFDIRVRVSQFEFGEIGVYPLRIEARAQFGSSGGIGPAGLVQTYVPWFPDGPPHGRVRIAWLWPVVDQPHRGAQEVMLDDDLATSFRPGGRLDRLVRAAADGEKGGVCDPAAKPPETLPAPKHPSSCRADPVPMTYAVDPDLLFTANALTHPYQLVTGGGTKRIDDTAPAATWLTELRDATAPADVLSLPYADPDVVSLTAPDSGLADEVPLLREVGKRQTMDTLHKAPLTSVVWPPPGRLTRRAVESLTSGGATAVVADPIALPAPEVDPLATPDTDVGRLPTNTGQPVVLTIDPQLSALLAASPSDYPGDRLVEQRWLAETAMISAEAPSVARTILVAPPRRADLHAPVAANAIRDSGRLPWMCAVSLASVAVGSDSCSDETRPATTERPVVELEPPHADDPRLDPALLRRIRSLRATSTQFTDEILEKPTSPEALGTVARLTRARARAESSAWLDASLGAEHLTNLLAEDLTALRGKVHLQIGSGTVTLTSSSGVISVNVVNELDQAVVVGVRLDPRNAARLSTNETPIATVGPGRATQINLKVTAKTSGTFPVIAQLVDHDGQPFGPPRTLIVRSTQFGRVALAVTGIGAGVLLAAAGIRIVRRALSRGPA